MDSMNPRGLFTRLAHILNQAKICYMLTGSFAASAYGRIRGSQNVNFIIDANETQIRTLFHLLSEYGFGSDLESALEACATNSSFDLFDSVTSLRIFFTFRKPQPLSDGLDRRRSFPVAGGSLSIATPEDLIVAELQWAKTMGSMRQIEDVTGILKARCSELDLAYLNSQIAKFDVLEQWHAARKSAGVAD